MSTVAFWVPGKPQPKGSTKSFKDPNTGRIVTMGDNKGTKPWQGRVALFASQAGVALAPKGESVSVSVVFHLARPKGHYGTGRNAETLKASAPSNPVTKPDVDKLLRAVLDGLKGVAYTDDSQVRPVMGDKVYALLGQPEGARIWVTRGGA